MADLQLIGAVGVKVRPDTKGFRNTAKREILDQLRDIEGDMAVNVQPTVNARQLRREIERELDPDAIFDKPIDVRLNLNDDELQRSLKNIARMEVSDLKSVRIALDSRRATESLAELAAELDDIQVDMTRLPKDLERLNEDMAKTFEGLAESTSMAKDSLSNYTDELSDSTNKLQRHNDVLKQHKVAEISAINDLNRARDEQQAALEKLQAAREKVSEASGKAAKDLARIERDAAAEAEKAARARAVAIERNLKATQKAIRAEESAVKKLTSARESLNAKVAQQNEIIKDLERTEAKRRETMGEEKRILEEQIVAHKDRQRIIENEIEFETRLQNSREQSDTQLLRHVAGQGRAWRDYADAVRRNATLATSYMDWLERKSSISTAEQISDLAELRTRLEENARRRAEMMQAEATQQLQMAQNFHGVWDESFQSSAWERELDRTKQFADEAAAYIERKRPRVSIDTNVDPASAAMAESTLSILGRDRSVIFKPKVNRSTLSLLSDDFDRDAMRLPVRLVARNVKEFASEVAQAFSGIAFARRLGNDVRRAVSEFDKLALAATAASLKIGSIAMAGAAGLGFISTLTDDLFELSGLLLIAPAALTTMASAVYTTALGFDRFSEAVDGNAEALATFDENGQAAARSLGVLKTELNERIKPAFWEGIGDDLTNMADAIRGPVVRGMVAAAEEVGAAWGGIFRAMETFAESGDMDTAFDNMIEGLDGVSQATEPLFNALNDIGLAGSRWLPNFGRWAQRNAETFRDWADEAERTGKMDQWISDSLNHLYSLAGITADSVRFIDSLARAAERAGFGGLASLANAIEDIADATAGEFFQRNGTNIFRGALEGIEAFTEGLGQLGEAVLRESRFIEDTLESIGEIGGNIFSGMAEAVNNPRMLNGISEFLADVKEATTDLGPLFDKMAHGVGDTSRLVGEMFKGIVNIADAFFTVWDQSTKLTDAMEKLIPLVTDVVASFIEMARIPLGVLMDSVAGLIELFVALPGPVQAVVAALGAAALLAPRLRQIGSAVRNFADSFRTSQNAIGGWRNTWRTAMGTMSDSGRVFMENSRMISSMDRSIARAAFSWRDAMSQFRTANQTFRDTLRPAEAQARRLATSGIPQLQASLANLQRTQDTLRRSMSAGLIDTRTAESRIATLGARMAVVQQDIADRGRAMGVNLGNNIRDGVDRGTANMGTTLRDRLRSAFTRDSTGFFAPIERDAQRTATRTRGIFSEMMTAIRSAMGRDTTAGGLSALPASLQGAIRETDNLTRANRNLAASFGAIRTSSAITAISQFAGATRAAAGAIGASGAAGLRSALSGLSAVLGGPWGIALMAGVVALTSFGAAAARERRKIEDLRGTLDDFGNTTAATVNRVAEDLNGAKASFMKMDIRDWLDTDGVQTAGETLQKLGFTARDMADMMVNNRPKFDEFMAGLEGVSDKGIASSEGIEQFAASLGVPKEVIAGMIPELYNLQQVLENQAGAVQGAGLAFTTLNGQVAPVSQTSKDLAEAFERMADEAGTAEDRVSGLQDALAILNGDELSTEDAIQRMNEGISELGANLATIIPGIDNWGDAIDSATGKINTSHPAAQNLRTEMKGMVEDAQLVGSSTGDMAGALQQGKDAFLGAAAAAGASAPEIDLLSAAWDHLAGGTPDEVQKIFEMKMGESVDEAEALANKFGLEWDNQEFVSWLSADSTQAQIEGKTAEEIAQLWADTKAEATFGAKTDTIDAAMDAAKQMGIEWDAAKFTAWLEADAGNAKLATEDIHAAVRKFADDTYDPKITLDDEGVQAKLGEIDVKLQSIKDPVMMHATLTADDEQFNAVMETAKAKGAEIVNPDAFRAFITANAEQFHAEGATVDEILNGWATLPHEVRVNGATDQAELKLDNVKAKADEVDQKDPTVNVQEAGSLDAALKIGQVGVKVGEIDGKQAVATVSAIDNASSTITVPKAAAEEFAKDYNGTITAMDTASAVISLPKAEAEAFAKQYPAELTANDLASGAITVPKSLAESYVKNYGAEITAVDGASATISVPQGNADAFAKQYAADMTATDGASLVIQVPQGLADAFVKEYNGTVTASDGASSTISIPQANADAFVKEYNGDLTSTDSASGTIGRVQGAADGIVGEYNAHVTASDGASGVLSNIVGWLDNIRSGATAFINTITGNADGNIYGSVKPAKFADGGFIKALGEIQAFASGGFSKSDYSKLLKLSNRSGKENHYAQIAKAKTPYRIWAEPETQGEAYIPLAVSKRARSTRIWEETGNRLGVNVEEYAEGGIKAGKINGDPTVSTAGTGGRQGSGVTVNQTIYYPVSEPASTSTNRGLQLAAALI